MAKSTIGPFNAFEGGRIFYVNAPLVLSVALLQPSVTDGVHWAVSFEIHNSNCSELVQFDTQQAAQAAIDDWRSKVD